MSGRSKVMWLAVLFVVGCGGSPQPETKKPTTHRPDCGAPYWVKVLDADTGQPILGATVQRVGRDGKTIVPTEETTDVYGEAEMFVSFTPEVAFGIYAKGYEAFELPEDPPGGSTTVVKLKKGERRVWEQKE